MRKLFDDRQSQTAVRLLIVLYTLCVIGPATAIASSDDAIAAHCLTDNQVEAVTNHVRQDGTSHKHSVPGEDQGNPGKCCGLFSLSALAPTIDFFVERQPHTLQLAPVFAKAHSGRGSDRIDRPPKSFLSL
jgi:hypothetical protein